MELVPGRCLIPDRLAEIGKSQKWLAARMKKTPQQISDWVTGRRTMNISHLRTASEIIGCPMESIYEWEESDQLSGN